MTRTLPLAAAAVAALTLVSCAAVPSGPAAPIALAATSQPAPSPADYLRMAAASDLYEIQSSQLVLQTSQDQALRRFADMMVEHHTATTAALTAAARAEGMTPPPATLDAAKAAMIRDLQAATGAARDALYRDQQVMAHRDALTLHASFAEGGARGALKAAAASAVPVVSGHYNQIVAMAPSSAGRAS